MMTELCVRTTYGGRRHTRSGSWSRHGIHRLSLQTPSTTVSQESNSDSSSINAGNCWHSAVAAVEKSKFDSWILGDNDPLQFNVLEIIIILALAVSTAIGEFN